jgi:nitrate reductase molybdenum cofactor assembly chaperone NarJ/NarW
MTDLRVAHAVSSMLLSYPDDALRDQLPVLRAATAALPAAYRVPLGAALSYLETTPLPQTAVHYVATFDLQRRCCLYLTYYTHGDTRRRGLALLRFRRAYRAAGLQVSDDELPDHLAVVLEFSAAGFTDQATELLVEHRPGLELLYRALRELGSPYAQVVAAVRTGLPAPGPDELRAAQDLAERGPSVEQVGIT